MLFASTRTPSDQLPLREAIFQGLAPDGGLYLPLEEPNLRDIFLAAGPDTSFVDLAGQILHGLFPGDFSAEVAGRLCREEIGRAHV